MTDLNQAQEEQETEEILNGIFEENSEPEDDVEAVEQQPEPETSESEGEEEIKGETSEEEPETKAEKGSENEEQQSEPPSDKEHKSVPIAVVHDLRRKLKEKNEIISGYESGKVDENAPDPAEDREAYEKYMRDKIRQEDLTERIENSRGKMLGEQPDYEEMEKIFLFHANQDPELGKKMNSHPEPARFAYETAKAFEKEREDKMRARIMAEIEVDSSQDSKVQKTSASGVPNLNKMASKGSTSASIQRSTDLDDAIGEDSY